ncbi:MAG: MmcQ/YjbR family DNA-binding protein, partial [Psychrosphaera sp.]|nr:MmcQ/YjbR family DNA-binding protein [Psychrosphaera sp.]
DDEQPAFTFKTSVLNFGFLSECEGYKPAPYFANRGMKWIQQFDNAQEKDQDLQYYLTESHRLVSSGLTKIKQKALGLNQDKE